MRVIIVGGGIMGLCGARAASCAGYQVVLYEQGPIPNPLASSTDQHRLIRFTYGAMTGYARMVQDAHAAWDRLFADLGRSHYRATGTLALAREEDGWVEDSVRSLEDLGVAFERWRPRDLARRLPFLELKGARFGLFSPSGGVLFAERILRDLARHLTARGVALHGHAPVRRVDPTRAAIVTAAGREDRGDALIVAAGAWAPQLLPALVGRLTPSRQVAVYLEPPADRLAAWRAAPMLLDQIEATQGGLLCRAAGRRHRAQGRRPRFLAARSPDRERTAAPRSPRSWRSP